jgi:hypothetical protein
MKETVSEADLFAGNVLQVAQYMTAFQSVYRYPDDPPPFFVTPDRLEEALRFDVLLKRRRLMQDEAEVFERRNQLEAVSAKAHHRLRRELNTVEKKIENWPSKSCQIYILTLLQRVQVWTTKAMVQDLLVSHSSPEELGSPPVCWSVLLNIPSATYANAGVDPISCTKKPCTPEKMAEFAKLFDIVREKRCAEIPHDNGLCSLALTPNIHTWLEFARLAHMVNQLPNEALRAQAAISPLAQLHTQGLRSTTAVKFKFRTVDLVALWIRAQRNTPSRRHLTQLFEVQEIKQPNGQKGYEATFAGNHRSMTRRVWSESPLLDQLVAYAVQDQLLCKAHLVEQELVRDRGTVPLQRLRKGNTQQRGQKRQRAHQDDQDDAVDPTVLTQLWRACQAFLLRSWARGHVSILQVLFGSVAERDFKNVNSSSTENDSTEYRFLGLLRQNELDSETLAGLEKLLLDGHYDGSQRFGQAVLALLNGWIDVLRSQDTITPDLYVIMNEWDACFQGPFYKQVDEQGIVATARSFIDEISVDEFDNTRDISRALSRFPPPWIDKCTVCGFEILDEHFRVCACCEGPVHRSCCRSDRSWSVGSFLEAYSPLKHIFRIRLPLVNPDFRKLNSAKIAWTTKVLVCSRGLGESGELLPYGMTVPSTEKCTRVLESLLSGELRVTDVDFLDLPLACDHQGLLVTKVSDNGCAKKAGVEVGDVIVAMELIDLAGAQAETKFTKSKIYTLSHLERHQQRALFQEAATKVKFVVKRPNAPIVLNSHRFLAELQAMNSSMSAIIRANESMWYCAECILSDESRTLELEHARILREAHYCRSLIRRLSVEECGRTYYDVPIESDKAVKNSSKSGFSVFVSLRRLELMMESIIARYSVDKSLESNDACFFVGSKRLDWAPDAMESKPLELLCRGIDHIATQTIAIELDCQEFRRPDGSILFKNFLRLFCSWCLAGSPATRLLVATKCPVFASSLAWTKNLRFCSLCGVWQSDASEEVCSYCLRMQLSPTPDYHDTLCWYEKCSSLIGSTILLLPGDPLLVSTEESLKNLSISMEQHGRPFELLCVAFIPSIYANREDDKDSRDGTFYLLPVANTEQLKFLLAKCTLREFIVFDVDRWKADGLLDLPGVIQLSFKEVRSSLEKTKLIEEAIASKVSEIAQYSYEVDNTDHAIEIAHTVPHATYAPCQNISCSSSLGGMENNLALSVDNVENCSLLATSATLQSFACGRNPVFLAIRNSCKRNLETNNNATTAHHCEVSFDPFNRYEKGERLSREYEEHRLSSTFDGGHDRNLLGSIQESVTNVEVKAHQHRAAVQVSREMVDSQKSVTYTPKSHGNSKSMQQNKLELIVIDNDESATVGQAQEEQPQTGNEQRQRHVPGSPRSTHGTGVFKSRLCPSNFDVRMFAPAFVVPQGNGNLLTYFCTDALNLAWQRQSLQKTYFQESLLTVNDLYMPIFPRLAAVLTIAETSLLLHSARRGMLMLGLRMLCPRYDVLVLLSELGLLLKSNCFKVPTLPNEVWSQFLAQDYKRQVKESEYFHARNERDHRPVQFYDLNFEYRMPFLRFPVDRFLESFFRCGIVPGRIAVDFFEFDSDNRSTVNIESIPSRIRGGGDEIEGQPRVPLQAKLLSDIPKSMWNKTLVYSYCTTTLADKSHGLAKFIGHVDFPPNSSEEVDEVQVSMFFLSNVGLFTSKVIHSLHPTILSIASESGEEAKIESSYEQLRRRQFAVSQLSAEDDEKEGRNGQSTAKPLQERLHCQGVGPSNTTQPPVCATSSATKGFTSNAGADSTNISDDVRDEDAVQLLQSLALFDRVKLGILPDKRNIYMLISDPTVVYLSSLTNEPGYPAFLPNDHLERCQPSGEGIASKTSFCPWGCLIHSDSGNDSTSSLQLEPSAMYDHVFSRHSFGIGTNHRVVSLGGDRLSRLDNGNPVTHLFQEVTLASLRAAPFLDNESYVQELNVPSTNGTASGVHHSVDTRCVSFRSSFLVKARRGQDNVLRNACDSYIVQLVRLAWRLFTLFDVHGDGNFRSKSLDLEQITGFFRYPKIQTLPADKVVADYDAHRCTKECRTCSLETERVVIVDQANTTFSGIGCTAFTKIRFNRTLESPEKKAVLKHRLLELTGIVPLYLRKKAALWTDKHLVQFRIAIRMSQEIRTLCQSFAVLLSSVNYSKLPDWWRCDGPGWLAIHTILNVASESHLFLHMHLFEFAISEAAGIAIAEPSPCSQFFDKHLAGTTSQSFLEQIEHSLRFARSMGVGPFVGDEDFECVVCQDGGSLLCCEFCPTVCHKECAGLRDDPEAFVCSGCVADFKELHDVHSVKKLN